MTQPNPRLSSLFKLEYPQSVGVYDTYDEAQKVVDFLADARFPVENLCIVGTELRSVERVLGRRSWGTVIGQGVQSGVSTGLMITLLMWLFVPNDNPLLLALYALGIGIIVGIGMAALGYWMSQGKRDFTSVSQTIATKYEVLAEHKVAGKAREMVAGMPGARAAQFNPAPAAVSTPPVQGYVPQPAPGYAQQPPPGYGQPYGQGQGAYGQGQQHPYGQAPAQGGYPQGAYPQGGYPQGGYPQGGYQQGGYDQGGYGQPAYPPFPQPSTPGAGPDEYGHSPEVEPESLGYPDEPAPEDEKPAEAAPQDDKPTEATLQDEKPTEPRP